MLMRVTLPTYVLSLGVSSTLLLSYWLSIGGAALPLGTFGDACSDVFRQEVGETLLEGKWMNFFSSRFMAPNGDWIPYRTWSIERDLFGGLFWILSPRTPYLGIYFLLSLFISWSGLTFLLKRIVPTLFPFESLFACLIVLFNPSRHLKTWIHFDFLPQHWLILSLFLDVHIWNQAVQKAEFSWERQAWRLFLLMGVFFSSGYYWSISLLCFTFVQLGLLWWSATGKLKVLKTTRTSLHLPLSLCAGAFLINLAWYFPLYQAVKNYPIPRDPLSWHSKLGPLFSPLFASIDTFRINETSITIGWSLWALFLLCVSWSAKQLGVRRSLALIMPFALTFLLGCAYVSRRPEGLALFLFDRFPFFQFFRVASRWGLVFPLLLSAMAVLGLPLVIERWREKRPVTRWTLAAAGIALLLSEVQFFLRPVDGWSALPVDTQTQLNQIRFLPGRAILDLPFCVVGGNGVCAQKHCPNFPQSARAQCFRLWHEKQVYGIYQGRMAEGSCASYEVSPYAQWFQAWQESRCFNRSEWKDLCQYLERKKPDDLAGIMLHSAAWPAATDSQCQSEIERHLGKPISQSADENGKAVTLYRPICRSAPSGH